MQTEVRPLEEKRVGGNGEQGTGVRIDGSSAKIAINFHFRA